MKKLPSIQCLWAYFEKMNDITTMEIRYFNEFEKCQNNPTASLSAHQECTTIFNKQLVSIRQMQIEAAKELAACAEE
jgi:hypothetical protein